MNYHLKFLSCFFFFYSFPSYCHTEPGVFDFANRSILFIYCWYRITGNHQLPYICWCLQKRRSFAIQPVLSAQPYNSCDRHLRIHHRRIHQHFRHHETYDLISQASFVLVIKLPQQIKNYRWSYWVVNTIFFFHFTNDQSLLLLHNYVCSANSLTV